MFSIVILFWSREGLGSFVLDRDLNVPSIAITVLGDARNFNFFSGGNFLKVDFTYTLIFFEAILRGVCLIYGKNLSKPYRIIKNFLVVLILCPRIRTI